MLVGRTEGRNKIVLWRGCGRKYVLKLNFLVILEFLVK